MQGIGGLASAKGPSLPHNAKGLMPAHVPAILLPLLRQGRPQVSGHSRRPQSLGAPPLPRVQSTRELAARYPQRPSLHTSPCCSLDDG